MLRVIFQGILKGRTIKTWTKDQQDPHRKNKCDIKKSIVVPHFPPEMIEQLTKDTKAY